MCYLIFLLLKIFSLCCRRESDALREQQGDDFRGMYFAKTRKMIWDLMEKPSSSKAAKVYILHNIASHENIFIMQLLQTYIRKKIKIIFQIKNLILG